MAKLEKENAILREQIAERDSYVAQLKEQLQAYIQRRFAASSEKTSPEQLGLFNEAEAGCEEHEENLEEPGNTEVKSHSRIKRPRVSIPEHYPREEIVYDLPAQEQVCPMMVMNSR